MNTSTPQVKTIKEKNLGISTVLAFALLPLSGFATDVYIPSMPDMGLSMHISSIQVQFTLTAFLISYGVAQLFVGSILDTYGRYKFSMVSLVIFALASLVIAVTHNIYLVYLMRIIHGLTVAMIIVAKRALFVDMYTGEKLKHYLSLFTIIWSTGPIVAPFIGGYLQKAFGWESNFYFLAGFAVIMAIMEFIFSGETLKHITKFDLSKITGIYAEMIKTASFTLGLLMLGLAYSMVMVYNMTGPFIIEHQMNLSPVITGYCSLLLGIAWMIGGFIGKATINRPFYNKLLVTIGSQITFVVLMLVSLSFVSNLYSMLLFAFLIHVGAGNTYNNYFTYSLRKFPNNAGIASGLTGGVVYIIVSILSYGIIYFVPAKDETNLGYSYLILIALSAIIMFVIYRMNKKSSVVAALA